MLSESVPYFEYVNPEQDFSAVKWDEHIGAPVPMGWMSFTCDHGTTKRVLLNKIRESLEAQREMDWLKNEHAQLWKCQCHEGDYLVKNPLPPDRKPPVGDQW
jgi:hypothetical protein